jgi:NADH-quinone oxidoreductase subunit L
VHSNNMSDMGGLRKKMPVTFVTFAIGSYALAGLPLLAGFWSKDGLLVTAYAGHKWLFVVMLITAALTAFYTARMVWLTFFGEYAGDREAAHVVAGAAAAGGHDDAAEHHAEPHAEPHDPPRTMTLPLIGLAFATCVVGFLGSAWFHAVYFKWVTFGRPEEEHFVWWIAILSSVIAIGGAWVGYRMYREHKVPDPLQVRLGGFWTVLTRRFYIDDFYMRDIVLPVRDQASAGAYWFNQSVLDRIVNGAAWVTRGVSRLINWFDKTVIDGFVNALGGGAEEAGSLLKYIQSGNVQWYAVGLFVGVIALAIIFVKAA